ncbi:MAG: L-2-amino-thiazoline-4-carboxylic acid hydrolase [Desulfobacterales bacterium]
MENFLEKVEPFAIEIRKSVMNDLKPRVAHLVDAGWPEVIQAVRDYEISLEKTNAWRVEDEKGAIHLKTGCTILAVYRALEPYFEDKQKLLDVMKEMIDQVAFGEGGENHLINRYGLDPHNPSEAWDRFCSSFLRIGQEEYGASWVYEQGIRDHKRFFINIRKCGFKDFFIENGAREVLYLLCSVDYIWADALEKYNITFLRPTTLSEGSDACRFQFFKSD